LASASDGEAPSADVPGDLIFASLVRVSLSLMVR
jgi:hypothetical protein